jgi:hypothetical protein
MYLFQQMDKAAKSVTFKDTEDAKKWYRDQALNINQDDIDPEEVIRSKDPFRFFKVDAFGIGKMYMFMYDAKYKDTLPFFDIFPLVFPIEPSKDGFLGINLHYLPPGARAQMMDALHTIANNDKYNSSTKLQISYQLLKSYPLKFGGYKECIKKYLFGHIKSQLHYVNPKDWDKALLLPLQKWSVNQNPYYASKKSPPY